MDSMGSVLDLDAFLSKNFWVPDGLWVQITDLDMFSTAGCQNLVTVGK